VSDNRGRVLAEVRSDESVPFNHDGRQRCRISTTRRSMSPLVTGSRGLRLRSCSLAACHFSSRATGLCEMEKEMRAEVEGEWLTCHGLSERKTTAGPSLRLPHG
jgi:hypothetical protein